MISTVLEHYVCCCTFNTDIEVEFTQVLFSGDESSGFIEARVMAFGYSPWPYEVIIVPWQSDPPSALGNI